MIEPALTGSDRLTQHARCHAESSLAMLPSTKNYPPTSCCHFVLYHTTKVHLSSLPGGSIFAIVSRVMSTASMSTRGSPGDLFPAAALRSPPVGVQVPTSKLRVRMGPSQVMGSLSVVFGGSRSAGLPSRPQFCPQHSAFIVQHFFRFSLRRHETWCQKVPKGARKCQKTSSWLPWSVPGGQKQLTGIKSQSGFC